MRTREIQHEQWQPFFQDFTQLHQGKHVNIETMDAGAGPVHSELCDLALVGVVAAAADAGKDPWIEVIGRAPQGSHAAHSIANPTKVQVAEEENGRAVALEIESLDGSITMIRFQPSRDNMPEGFVVS